MLLVQHVTRACQIYRKHYMRDINPVHMSADVSCLRWFARIQKVPIDVIKDKKIDEEEGFAMINSMP